MTLLKAPPHSGLSRVNYMQLTHFGHSTTQQVKYEQLSLLPWELWLGDCGLLIGPLPESTVESPKLSRCWVVCLAFYAAFCCQCLAEQ